MSELDDREARVRELLAEVRGAIKDLNQVLGRAEDMRRTLIREEVRPLVTEVIREHSVAAAEALGEVVRQSDRVIKARMEALLLEVEGLRAAAVNPGVVRETGFFAVNAPARKPR